MFVSAKAGGDKISREMDRKIAVIETKMDGMEGKIETHNGYARLFSENIPAIKQHLGEIDRRLENAERKM